MLWSMGSQRVGHDLATEQQQHRATKAIKKSKTQFKDIHVSCGAMSIQRIKKASHCLGILEKA